MCTVARVGAGVYWSVSQKLRVFIHYTGRCPELRLSLLVPSLFSSESVSWYPRGRVQSFGGSNWHQNFLLMFNKMRVELLDESSITLAEEGSFVASSLFIAEAETESGGVGLLQVFMLRQSWLDQQTLWCPEHARAARNDRRCLDMYDISQWWRSLREHPHVADDLASEPMHQIVKSMLLEEALQDRKRWRASDWHSLLLLHRVICDMIDVGFKGWCDPCELRCLSTRTEAISSFFDYATCCQESCMRGFMRLSVSPWLPLLKYEALVFSRPKWLAAVFSGRSAAEASQTREVRVMVVPLMGYSCCVRM